MRIRHAEDGNSLDLGSGGGVQSCLNVGVTLFAFVHHLHLHTEERISWNKNGTRRYRVSHLAVVMRDGTEVLIGTQRRGGLGGQQPLLEQAGEIALFLGVPLERTGIGAPIGYDLPPGVGSGPRQSPDPSWGASSQGPAGPSYGHRAPGQGYPPQQHRRGVGQGFHPGPAGPHPPGQHPGGGGGLPDWTRR